MGWSWVFLLLAICFFFPFIKVLNLAKMKLFSESQTKKNSEVRKPERNEKGNWESTTGTASKMKKVSIVTRSDRIAKINYYKRSSQLLIGELTDGSAELRISSKLNLQFWKLKINSVSSLSEELSFSYKKGRSN